MGKISNQYERVKFDPSPGNVNYAGEPAQDLKGRMKKEKRKREAIESLEKLYSMRIKSDKSAVEWVREARRDRVDGLAADVEEDEK